MTSIRKVDCMKYFKEEELYSGSIGSAIVMLDDVDDERDVFTIEKLGLILALLVISKTELSIKIILLFDD